MIACDSVIKGAPAASGPRIGRARQAARLQTLCVSSHLIAFALVPLGGGFETDAVAVTRNEVRPTSPRADARMTSDFGPANSLRNAIPCGFFPDLPTSAIFLPILGRSRESERWQSPTLQHDDLFYEFAVVNAKPCPI